MNIFSNVYFRVTMQNTYIADSYCLFLPVNRGISTSHHLPHVVSAVPCVLFPVLVGILLLLQHVRKD